MWGYASDLMTTGVAVSMMEGLKYVKFQVPSSGCFIRGRGLHISSRDARKHFTPYFGVIFKHDKRAGNRIAAELGLGDSEVDYLVEA